MKRVLKKTFAISGAVIVAVLSTGMCLLGGGCSTTHSRTEFDEIVATTNRDTLGAVYYKGRKNGYDYFKARWNIGSKNMRVAISESPITKPFGYTLNEEAWLSATFMHLEGCELEQAIPKKLNAEQE